MKVATRTKRNKPKKRTLADLEHEVSLLRSAVIGLIGKDEEGEYRPEFVARVLKASRANPTHTFTDAKSFLKLFEKV